MANKIVAVRIKQQDGHYSDAIPITAKVENVAYDNDTSLLDVLGNVDTTKGSIQEQLNNVVVDVDNTLTREGVAADAQAVGDRIGDLEAAVEELNPIKDINSADLWAQGAIKSSSGVDQSDGDDTFSQRVRTISDIPNNVYKIVNTAPNSFGYAVAIYIGKSWNATNWLGIYDNTGEIKKSSPTWITGDTDISDVKAAAQIKSPTTIEFYYRLIGANHVNGVYKFNTVPSDSVSLKLMADTTKKEETIEVDNTMSIKGMPADAKTVGLYLETITPGITDIVPFADWSDDGLYISLASATNPSFKADINNPRPVSNPATMHSHYMIIEAHEGEVYTITAQGASIGRAYGFIMEDGTILDVANAGAILQNTIVTAPSNTKWLVVNDASNPFTGKVCRGIFTSSNSDLPSMSGIPVLELTGNTLNMSKEQKVTLNYSIFDRTGTCTVKWQGSSSLRYNKKNYTVTFDNAMDAYVNWQNYRKIYGTQNGAVGYPVTAYDFSEGNSYAAGAIVVYDKHFYKFTEAHPAGEWIGTDANYAYPATSGGPTEVGSRVPFNAWGRQKKYCFKANYIDASHARNIVNARLWGRMVAARASRNEISDTRITAPNYGAIDGFPCEIKINGVSQGLYTFNIPKDKWTFNMGTTPSQKNTEFVIGGDNNYNTQCKWSGTFDALKLSNLKFYNDDDYDDDRDRGYVIDDVVVKDDTIYRCSHAGYINTTTNSYVRAAWENCFSAEVVPKIKNDNDSELTIAQLKSESGIKTVTDENKQDVLEKLQELRGIKAAMSSLNAAIAAVTNANSNTTDSSTDILQSISAYLDIDSVIDYFIYTCCIANNDALARNILYGTYDGQKWFMSAYDLDTTYGFNPYGTQMFSVKGARTNLAGAGEMNGLARLIIKRDPNRLLQRYKMWRSIEKYEGWVQDGHYIHTKKEVNEEVSITNPMEWTADYPTGKYIIIPCVAGDCFTVTAQGRDTPRTWAFVDSSYHLISRSQTIGEKLTDAQLQAPENAAYLIINDAYGDGYVSKGFGILSDESVWNEFAQFLIDIPSRDYRIDRDIWPMLPGTEVMTVPNYMEYYRAHCKALDEEVEALVPNNNNANG